MTASTKYPNLTFYATILSAVLIAWITLTASQASAATLVVDAAGSGSFTTISSAIKKAKAGDTIEVRPGRYAEDITLKKDVILAGAGAEHTTVVARDTVLSVSGVKSGRVSGLTLEVTAPGKTGGVALKGCGANFTLENTVLRCSGQRSAGMEAMLWIDGGAPRLTGNVVSGGIHVEGGARIDLSPNTIGTQNPGDENGHPVILARLALRGETRFQGRGVVGVDLSKPGAKAINAHLRDSFPDAITVADAEVTLPAGYWEFQSEVERIGVDILNGSAIHAQVQILLELREQSGAVVVSARSSADRVDSTPALVEVNGEVVANYGGIANAVSRAFGQDPFAESLKAAMAAGIPQVGASAAGAFGMLEELKALEIAKAGGRSAVESFAQKATSPRLKAEATAYLIDLDVAEALNEKDISALNRLAQAYPEHPRTSEIKLALAMQKSEAKMEEAKQAERKMAADMEARQKEYAPAKTTDTVAAYEEFIAKYPDNPNVADARSRIEALREYFLVTETASPDQMIDVKREAKVFGDALTRVRVGTKLPVVSVQGDWVKVGVSGGEGYLPKSAGRIGKKSEL